MLKKILRLVGPASSGACREQRLPGFGLRVWGLGFRVRGWARRFSENGEVSTRQVCLGSRNLHASAHGSKGSRAACLKPIPLSERPKP